MFTLWAHRDYKLSITIDILNIITEIIDLFRYSKLDIGVLIM